MARRQRWGRRQQQGRPDLPRNSRNQEQDATGRQERLSRTACKSATVPQHVEHGAESGTTAAHSSRDASVGGTMSGTMMVMVPAACAAVTPWLESSTATQTSGFTPSRDAASRYRSGLGLPRVTSSRVRIVSKRVADSRKRQMRIGRAPRRRGHDRHRALGGVQRIQQFDRAILQRQAGPENFVAPGDESLADLGERKILAVTCKQHRLAFRPGKADHGVAQCFDIVGVTRRIQRRDQTVEIDPLGVEQRSIHVEQDGADVPSVGHVAAALAACAALRRQSGHRQSLPSDGIGKRKSSSVHQHGPDRLQVNSVPQPAQARRREGGFSFRFVMNRAAL